ncbi:class I SAM-dependent methyltransferase [Paenactinomyces guangxiensis]|uniref:Class I SAM-dependent methyltransferase n=1 Tax=Paenactinomyces guangxiensis TaxID=1490290 RepID=A0A7W2A969_9BACL|nr:class I SAM-dependent methyltransferase [Paenactinomyces guangxiensis]MBA4495410.1 class I SAM-dependent methyltransferase [Paenactinomyces guangxiensis]MBH8592469.1 class I SAM-dependent methyltransferase [Paenactinomyces guangxiensis]
MPDHSIYDWPDYYDWTSPGLERDLTYYIELAKQTGGPVLELGCGTGRCSLAIARLGIPVVGVDLSSPMLQKARQRAKKLNLSDRVRWVEADMSRFSLNERFPLVIIPYRSFLHLLTVRDQISTLKRIRQHLTDGGLFAFNIFVPRIRDLYQMEGKYSFRGSFLASGGKERVDLYDLTEFDYFNQTAYITRYAERFDEKGHSLGRIRMAFRLRYIFPAELNHLLALCGFKIINRFGSFHRTPFDARSEELIIEAVKRPGQTGSG